MSHLLTSTSAGRRALAVLVAGGLLVGSAGLAHPADAMPPQDPEPVECSEDCKFRGSPL
jgi:hypothetical protein